MGGFMINRLMADEVFIMAIETSATTVGGGSAGVRHVFYLGVVDISQQLQGAIEFVAAGTGLMQQIIVRINRDTHRGITTRRAGMAGAAINVGFNGPRMVALMIGHAMAGGCTTN